MNAEVKAIKHLDVLEKPQYYIKIETSHGTHMINVGEKTFNKINELTKNKKETAK